MCQRQRTAEFVRPLLDERLAVVRTTSCGEMPWPRARSSFGGTWRQQEPFSHARRVPDARRLQATALADDFPAQDAGEMQKVAVLGGHAVSVWVILKSSFRFSVARCLRTAALQDSRPAPEASAVALCRFMPSEMVCFEVRMEEKSCTHDAYPPPSLIDLKPRAPCLQPDICEQVASGSRRLDSGGGRECHFSVRSVVAWLILMGSRVICQVVPVMIAYWMALFSARAP